MCENVPADDRITFFSQPNCGGDPTAVDVAQDTFLIPKNAQSVHVPRNMSLTFGTKDIEVEYDFKVWGNFIEDMTLSFESVHESNFVSFREFEFVRVLRRRPQPNTESSVPEPIITQNPTNHWLFTLQVLFVPIFGLLFLALVWKWQKWHVAHVAKE